MPPQKFLPAAAAGWFLLPQAESPKKANFLLQVVQKTPGFPLSQTLSAPPQFPQWLQQQKQEYQFKKFMEILKKLTEPAYAAIRKKIPPVAGYDVSPYALLLVIAFVGSFISHLTRWISQYM